MLEQENLCCAQKYCGNVRNLLEFLLYHKCSQYSYLLKYLGVNMVIC